MDIKTLSIDLETRSGADISKAGLYRYAEDPEFDILLFGVSVNHGPVILRTMNVSQRGFWLRCQITM